MQPNYFYFATNSATFYFLILLVIVICLYFSDDEFIEDHNLSHHGNTFVNTCPYCQDEDTFYYCQQQTTRSNETS